ncbi:MAG: nickel/cobalt transporter [Armatimonadota bacterium]
MRRGWLGAVLAACSIPLLLAAPLLAHPLGNFSINRYTAIEARSDGVFIQYVVDLAEVPTFQETAHLAGDEMEPHLARRVSQWLPGLRMTADSAAVPLIPTAVRVTCLEGAGGLPVLRIEADLIPRLTASAGGAPSLRFVYRDTNFPDRAGWKEIVVSGPAVLTSTVAAQDRGTNALRVYPQKLLNDAPPSIVEAIFEVRLNGTRLAAPRVSATPGMTFDLTRCRRQATAGTTAGSAGPRSGSETTAFGTLFRQLAGGRLDPGLLTVALLGAFLLGAYHALTPGHGKTILAAYFVGSRGTPGQALLLGFVTTLTHTSGVFLLGLATLFASRFIVPERLYPILSGLSGLMLLGVGGSLFWRRLRTLRQAGRGTVVTPHEHHRQHHHTHGHHDHGEQHLHAHGHTHAPAGDVRARDLIALGVTGGLLPCPSALVVMLASISVGQVGLGLGLITTFSVGLASVLIAGGLLMVYVRSFMERVLNRGAPGGQAPSRWLALARPVLHRLPVVSAAVVALLGLVIILQSGMSVGLGR